jgi:hypothetical protein
MEFIASQHVLFARYFVYYIFLLSQGPMYQPIQHGRIYFATGLIDFIIGQVWIVFIHLLAYDHIAEVGFHPFWKHMIFYPGTGIVPAGILWSVFVDGTGVAQEMTFTPRKHGMPMHISLQPPLAAFGAFSALSLIFDICWHITQL